MWAKEGMADRENNPFQKFLLPPFFCLPSQTFASVTIPPPRDDAKQIAACRKQRKSLETKGRAKEKKGQKLLPLAARSC